MTIIHRYLTKDFLITFSMTLLVFTFVMTAATIVKAIDLMARGVSGTVILQVFAYNMPYILTFSIPMSVMTAALLLFSRLSFDGEITAMKASGLSMWQIVSPVILIAIALTVLCTYLNNTAAPNGRYARREALHNLGVEDPIGLLDEGRFVRDFPGLMIYIGKKERDRVEDIVVYESGEDGVKRHVRARWGEVRPSEDQSQLRIDLHDVRIEQPDADAPLDPAKTRMLTAQRYPVVLDLSEILREGKVRKATKDQTIGELMHVIRHTREVYPDAGMEIWKRQRMKRLVEANKRLALSVSCFAFVLVAIPLGMKSRRKESSIGVAISLLATLVFYGFIVLAKALVEYETLRPDLIIWVPVLGGQLGGYLLMQRVK